MYLSEFHYKRYSDNEMFFEKRKMADYSKVGQKIDSPENTQTQKNRQLL